MKIAPEQLDALQSRFNDSTELTLYLRDTLRLPATDAKSIAWSCFEQRTLTQKPIGQQPLKEAPSRIHLPDYLSGARSDDHNSVDAELGWSAP